MQATIHNEFLTLTVDTHGAEAVSLKNTAGEELLWQADPAVWKRHAPILFPWTGKLPGRHLCRQRARPTRAASMALPAMWSIPCCKAEGDTIQLELRADEAIKAERFPFDFVLTSTFRLDGKTVHHTLQRDATPVPRNCALASATTRPSISPLMPRTPLRIMSSALTSRKARSFWTLTPTAC